MRIAKHLPVLFVVIGVITLISPVFAFELIIPDTGQDLCYDWEYIMCDEWHLEGPFDEQVCDSQPYCPNPGEDFYGQDAIYTINPPDLTDNGDGTVTDNLTGLMWEQKTTETEQYSFATYSEAASYCEDLSLGGNDDWRVPTRGEFSTLLNHSRTSPSLDVTYFPDFTYNASEVYYWTSSVYHDDPSQMWKVQMSFGVMEGVIVQPPPHKVRCVRGATEPEANFTDNGNGTVTDNVTGLMWEQKTDDGGSRDKDIALTWKDSLAYCEDLVLGSYTDWRLPNPKELERIVDLSTSNPAIDTNYFPNTNNDLYWTGTTCVGCHKHKAYAYDFSDGELYFGIKKVPGEEVYPEHYTRCVRQHNPCEGNFDCDGDQDGTDAAVFKIHFSRNGFNRPCTVNDPCYGDFDGDGDADGTDAATFKEDFGRSSFTNPCPATDRPIGVIYVIHGGMDTYEPQHMWDASVHQFSYDQNHSIYKFVIWNPAYWPLVLDTSFTDYAVRFIRMYEYSYERIGGTDPFHTISEQQLADIDTELAGNPYGLNFEVDWAGYMAADRVEHYAYPRFIYYGPDGPDEGTNCTYCGENDPGGAWPGCDPERYNVDGPVERLLKKGAYRIIMVDWTVGGVRFSKSFDVVEMTKRALDDWKTNYGVTVPLTWVNDYSNLMERSYPTVPEGWTRVLKDPAVDSHVLLNGSPNPIATDPMVATLNVEAIEAAFSSSVSDADTGVVIFNHALHDYNEWFDPKVNDSQIILENIKKELLDRHPTMDPDNIVGAFGGIQEVNPENGLEERNRPMRGESYGHAWLYQTDKVLPGGEWGYRYWEALEYLKNRGVQHIAIGFPQVVTDNVLNMVEIPNQVAAREIGYKNWLKWGTWDYTRYPTEGHPFPGYWGIWVNTDCGEWEINYASMTSAFSAGARLTGNSSGATARIKWFSGDTTSGSLTLKELSGTFQAGEPITDDKGGSATAAGAEIMNSAPECCFEMGGCGDPLRPYPPVRQTPLNAAMSDLDPHLCFDMSEYGHLGYDPAGVPPDPDNPVQDQYTGTWEMYSPPNADPRIGEMFARHVLNAIIKPLVYITNGEVEGVTEGGSLTFQAHVETGGKSPYTYEWSTNKDDAGWISQGTGSSWTFNTTGGDAGTYAVRCIVTDSQSETGEVIWEGFQVSTP